MDVEHYVNRIEATRDPERLELLRADVLQDDSLSESDKSFLTGRVGMYLADADREQYGADHGPDDALDEEA